MVRMCRCIQIKYIPCTGQIRCAVGNNTYIRLYILSRQATELNAT